MKPANIMLKPDDDIVLIDFGMARKFKAYNNHDTTHLVHTDKILGGSFLSTYSKKQEVTFRSSLAFLIGINDSSYLTNKFLNVKIKQYKN